ncbi:MAG: hypothetical protein AAFN59_10460, partial [Pseudomonadota bacterium]
FAAACTPALDADKDLPIKTVPASATTAQFLETYRSICVEAFPILRDMQSAASKLGFERVKYPDETGHALDQKSLEYNSYYNVSLDLSLEFGESVIAVSLTDWGGFEDAFQGCSLSGDVRDSENLTDGSTRAALQPAIVFTTSDQERRVLLGRLSDKPIARATLRLPRLYAVSSGSGIVGANRCGDEPKCKVWSTPDFGIRLPRDGNLP